MAGGSRWRTPLWPRTVAAGAVGLTLGVGGLAGGALLLYAGEGMLASAGMVLGVSIGATAAGLWVGAPERPAPGHRRMLGRWTLAIVAMVVASFFASAWLRLPGLQATTLGPPLAVVLLLAEPAYALGALLAALEARRRGWLGERWFALQAGPWEARRDEVRAGGVALPAMLGTAVGAMVASMWLIPASPPGPLFLGAALLLAGAGTLEMTLAGEATEGSMAERVVVVTGVGSPGQVGYAVARAFRERGARLVVADVAESVEQLAAELGDDVVAVRSDLTRPEGAEAVVAAARERWGRLDTLINAAGGLTVVKPLADTSPEEWRRESERNATTAFLMTRAALPLLREARGSVINFASPAVDQAVDGLGAYSAAKAGVVALTRALALEEKTHGVRVNAVAPEMVDTEQNRAAVEEPAAVTWVTRDQLVEAILFLARAEAVTGEVLHLQGTRRGQAT